MNATLEKFGYPKSLVKEFDHWCILLRQAQATLGALVLCSKHSATSFGALPQEAITELHGCISAIESTLGAFRTYDKINYLALMMVDPHVHFHVLPRYEKTQVFDGTDFPDPGWPGVPDLKSSATLSDDTRQKLNASLLDAFAQVV